MNSFYIIFFSHISLKVYSFIITLSTPANALFTCICTGKINVMPGDLTRSNESNKMERACRCEQFAKLKVVHSGIAIALFDPCDRKMNSAREKLKGYFSFVEKSRPSLVSREPQYSVRSFTRRCLIKATFIGQLVLRFAVY